MVKKRIIFTLLYKNKKFVMSRNFKTNEIGDANWIIKNYNFSEISKYIDELVIINLDREKKNIINFIEDTKKITKRCFLPIVLGGNINDLEVAKIYFKELADKIMINTAIFKKPEVIEKISKIYGIKLNKYLKLIENLGVGEIYLNSIDRDGTGQGCDLDVLKSVPEEINTPLIISGGVGKSIHMLKALKNKKVDAIATANLLNFIGDTLKKAREEIYSSNKDIVPR